MPNTLFTSYTPLSNHQQGQFGLFWMLALLGCGALYWLGLDSIFLLDDSPNLETLSHIHDNDVLNGMLTFATEGDAGRLGRPISLLSFAAQYYAWDSDPWSFKYINLMIHLLTGSLLFWLVLRIAQCLQLTARHGAYLALFSAGIWLIHPLQASTVLYVVQRMTQLSALFTVLGLLGYVMGRQHLAVGNLKRGWLLTSASIIFGGILATLSKENGVLLVFFVWALEASLLRQLPTPRYWRLWMAAFIYLPIIAFISLFIINYQSMILGTYAIRDFALGERLLTEARILSNYLAKITLLLPRDYSVFHDDVAISRSWFEPVTTLPSVLLILGLFASAVRLRKTYPIYAFAIFWFFAGHILESSVIGLVPYFEHRNYLPLFGIVLAMVYSAQRILAYIRTHYTPLAAKVLAVLGLALFPALTFSQVQLWSQPFLQAMLWADSKPNSRYAQSHAASLMEKLKHYELAQRYYAQMLESFPNDSGAAMLWFTLYSLHPEQVKPIALPVLLKNLQSGNIDTATISGLNYLLETCASTPCALSNADLTQIFAAIWQNPQSKLALYKAPLHYLEALFALREARYQAALDALDQAIVVKREVSWQLFKVNILISLQRFPEATSLLQQLRAQLSPVNLRLYTEQLRGLQLRLDARQTAVTH